MSNSAGRLIEADDLIASLIEGVATEAERVRLAELLRDEASVREVFVDTMNVHGLMSWQRAAGPLRLTDETTAATAEHPSPAAGAGAKRGSSASFEGARRVVGLMAAGVLMGAAVVAAWLGGVGGRTAPAPAAAPIAVLTDAEGVTWLSEPLSPGAEVGPQTVRIGSGRLELAYRSGPTLTITGPAEVDLAGAMGVGLRLGGLWAYVPPEASGFAVSGPHGMRVVDLGTEFAVAVGQTGEAEVFVYDGRVELRFAGGANPTELLLAGEGRRVDASGRAGDVAGRPRLLAASSAVATLTIGHWDRDGDLNGWTTKHVEAVEVAGGVLRGRAGAGDRTARDAMLTREDMAIDADRFRYLELRLRADGGSDAQVFWGSAAIAPERSVWLGAGGDEWRTYLIDFTGEPTWTGTIGTLRIDPVANIDHAGFAIDYVRLHAQDPRANPPDRAERSGAHVDRLHEQTPGDGDRPVAPPVERKEHHSEGDAL